MYTGTQPSKYLVANRSLLPIQGLALDIATGYGRNALFLAEVGLDVVGLDISEQAVKTCRERAAGRSNLCLAVTDLERQPFPSNFFDLVIDFNYLDRRLAQAIVTSLKPGGILVFETMTRAHLKWRPEFNPAFLLEAGELAEMFSSLTMLKYRECDIFEGSHPRSVASFIGRRDFSS